MPIRQLEPDVAAKIAAGEVVERPASVVKELIENSIDAGATQIRVDLMSGGLQLIRVTDNGTGIPSDELQLALSRHATSKVARIDDLEHIRSLGFRGEALASIAAVAEVTLLSHHRGASQGAQVSATNGQISDVTTAASPGGTTVTVRNLFSAVPARLKFLKSRHTEVSHSHHLLEQYALAYPEIRFSVFNEGRQIFSTPGDGQLPSVLLEIYGLQITEQMVPISSLDGRDDDAERPVVSGFTSLPTCYKSTRQHMSFFVNRRWVLSRMLSYAVEEAYHSLLMAGRHPLAVVNISVDPTQIDVNVHPAKTEIRFLKERRVYAAVQRAVRQAILQDAHMPGWGNDTVISKQGAMNRAPTSNERLAAESIELDLDIEEEEEQFIASSNGEEAPAFPRDNPWITVTEEETGTKPP
ncbi:MAG: DNA mismatch repair endonuclease MutL, partial [Ktedonobacteraceae bacterium]